MQPLYKVFPYSLYSHPARNSVLIAGLQVRSEQCQESLHQVLLLDGRHLDAPQKRSPKSPLKASKKLGARCFKRILTSEQIHVEQKFEDAKVCTMGTGSTDRGKGILMSYVSKSKRSIQRRQPSTFSSQDSAISCLVVEAPSIPAYELARDCTPHCT